MTHAFSPSLLLRSATQLLCSQDSRTCRFNGRTNCHCLSWKVGCFSVCVGFKDRRHSHRRGCGGQSSSLMCFEVCFCFRVESILLKVLPHQGQALLTHLVLVAPLPTMLSQATLSSWTARGLWKTYQCPPWLPSVLAGFPWEMLNCSWTCSTLVPCSCLYFTLILGQSSAGLFILLLEDDISQACVFVSVFDKSVASLPLQKVACLWLA
jgi:hypothetical protein